MAEKKLFFYGRGLFGARYMKGVSEADLLGIGHAHTHVTNASFKAAAGLDYTKE